VPPSPPQPHRPGYVSERVCSGVKGHSSRRLTAFRIIAGHRGTRHWHLDCDAREPMCFFNYDFDFGFCSEPIQKNRL